MMGVSGQRWVCNEECGDGFVIEFLERKKKGLGRERY